MNEKELIETEKNVIQKINKINKKSFKLQSNKQNISLKYIEKNENICRNKSTDISSN